MNRFKKLYLKLCDKFLYTTPPERMENGLKVMKINFEYDDNNEVLRFTVDRLCRLKMEHVTGKVFEDFIEFQFKRVNWLDIDQSAALCMWFKTRGANCLIGEIQEPATWFEKKMSRIYIEGLTYECARQYGELEQQKAS